MIIYKQADSIKELEQILELQKKNLPENLTEQEKKKEGFVTVRHNLDLLQRMNEACAHTIALHQDSVVGYALSMHPKFAQEIEVLKPMFHEIKKSISDRNDFMVMGQICIAKEYRRKGIFKGLYKNMKLFLIPPFKKIITEVDAKNQRSMNAHRAIGFSEVKRYQADGKEWSLLIWE